MSQGVIARRYAKALINLGEKEKTLESTGKCLAELAAVYANAPELRETLSDIKVSS